MPYSEAIHEAVQTLDKKYANFDHDFTQLAYLAGRVDEFTAPDAPNRAIVQQCRIAWRLYSSLLLLLANNFGLSAAVVARSLYEYVCGARYLMKHKKDDKILRDFRDYGFKTLYETAGNKSWAPPGLKASYQKVAGRFNERDKWHRKSIKTIAKEVGLGDLYDTFYKLMSSVAHGDALAPMMEAGLDWKNVGESIDGHFCDLSLEAAYMLMVFLYEDAEACLSLGCKEEVAILNSLSKRRLRSFAAEPPSRPSNFIN